MAIDVPWMSDKEIERHAKEFARRYNPSGQVPVDIEGIVEYDLKIDIIPTPGLDNYNIVAWISKDCRSISIDEYVFNHREARARFSFAHEVAHFLLHQDIIARLDFNGVNEWRQVSQDEIPDNLYKRLELQANRLAGFILVPMQQLENEFNKVANTLEQNGVIVTTTVDEEIMQTVAAELAKTFNVSKQTIIIRLSYDGLLFAE